MYLSTSALIDNWTLPSSAVGNTPGCPVQRECWFLCNKSAEYTSGEQVLQLNQRRHPDESIRERMLTISYPAVLSNSMEDLMELKPLLRLLRKDSSLLWFDSIVEYLLLTGNQDVPLVLWKAIVINQSIVLMHSHWFLCFLFHYTLFIVELVPGQVVTIKVCSWRAFVVCMFHENIWALLVIPSSPEVTGNWWHWESIAFFIDSFLVLSKQKWKAYERIICHFTSFSVLWWRVNFVRLFIISFNRWKVSVIMCSMCHIKTRCQKIQMC